MNDINIQFSHQAQNQHLVKSCLRIRCCRKIRDSLGWPRLHGISHYPSTDSPPQMIPCNLTWKMTLMSTSNGLLIPWRVLESAVDTELRSEIKSTGPNCGSIIGKYHIFSVVSFKLTKSLFYSDGTPPLNSSIENLTPSEEILHLRRQVAKLNRRVLTIELDNINKQQREKVLYAVGMAYFLIKAFMWLNRK